MAQTSELLSLDYFILFLNETNGFHKKEISSFMDTDFWKKKVFGWEENMNTCMSKDLGLTLHVTWLNCDWLEICSHPPAYLDIVPREKCVLLCAHLILE